jgi:molybdopterin/thiamine biosynthesis adenylyltransferase
LFEEDAPPEELLAGRRALESYAGVTLLEDYQWYELPDDGGYWALRCRLIPEVEPNRSIPVPTDWYVLVDPAYPWGSIRLYPAKDGGITQTFQHQNRNDAGDDALPWRTGDPCLDSTVRALGRSAYDPEPYGAQERLRWRFERSLAWLEAASRGELVLPGEPFELPQYLPTVGGLGLTVVFNEGSDTLPEWEKTADPAGLVDLHVRGRRKTMLVVDRFKSTRGEVLLEPRWGHALTEAKGNPHLGAWIRLNETPVLNPWKSPVTWGELREACKGQGLNLDWLLRKVSRHLRDGDRHALLLGFPIPDRVGGDPHRMHWQALLLPVLSRRRQTVHGFRANETGYRRRDRSEVLVDPGPVDWLFSENWHRDDVSTRGRLPESLASSDILVLGGGAMGSVVSELLTRSGVVNIAVMDDDRLEVGNLVRHTLGLADLHEQKADALAARLNLASAHAKVDSIVGRFPPADPDIRQKVQRCGVVLDCTGDDAVLRQLELFLWEGEKLFVSISLGFRAGRLFCFVAAGNSFPNEEYRGEIEPWIAHEASLYDESELPREGAGCWHPVFPARIDDVWLMAAAAVKELESAITTPSPEPRLIVFERYEEGGLFGGVRYADILPS